MQIVNFIIDNILTQAPITIALIAMLGLLLQKTNRTGDLGNLQNTAWLHGVISWFQCHCTGTYVFWGNLYRRLWHAGAGALHRSD